ncbi:MAG: UDP-N-acetylmuramoyl-tripeptide--D-alanyl-D-alanine ligase [Granulosicoccaceae bacterium]|jgi:UDP-N-acetylmuramoyl-tripeptide--D-alanyl-D-alanine ligase
MNVCSMTLHDAAQAIGVQYDGAPLQFHGVSTDTRSMQGGELFIALQGEHFDAHTFLDAAAAGGAVAAVVARRSVSALPLLLVEDTREALGRLALAWRQRFNIPFIAVTGSNGKTTVKEMIAAILRRQGEPLVTQGNLNNDIGVPQTLFRLEQQHTHAVIEMGANHAGEIAWLAEITRPDVAVVNNAMPAHLEGFGDLEGVARAKGELFEALGEEGCAIINADDDFADYWRTISRHCRQLDFGFSPQAKVTARLLDGQPQAGTRFMLQTPLGEAEVMLALPGRHNVMNALAAAAVATALDIKPDEISAGLAAMHTVGGRLQQVIGLHGATIIDDTYNANPASLRAAMDVLASLPGTRILVLGDMAELGAQAEALHAEAGQQARACGIDHLYTLGEYSRAATQAFGQNGLHFTSPDKLNEALRNTLDEHTVVLVKGSRAMHMEDVVKALLATQEMKG